MNQFFENLDTLFLSPSGSLTYHLVMIISIIISLQLILTQTNRRKTNARKKILIGLFISLALEVILLTLTTIAQVGLIEERYLLPIINRYFMTAMILNLAWLWVSSTERKIYNLLFSLLNALLCLLFIFSLWSWSIQYENFFFNQTDLDWIWGFTTIGLIIASLFVLAIQRPGAWGTGFVLLFVNLFFQIIHIFLYPTQADISSLNRMALLVVFPFLPTLIQERVSTSNWVSNNPRIKTYANFFNKKINLLTDGNPVTFKSQIPLLIKELSQAEEVFLIESDKIYSEVSFHPTADAQNDITVRIHRERIPELLHANEGQFALSFENVPVFRDEYKRIAPNLNLNPNEEVLVLPYPVLPERTTSIMLIFAPDTKLDEGKQSEISNMIGSLLLLLHQKQREEQLQNSIDRLIENNQNRLKPLTSINFQLLQQEYGDLQDKYDLLEQEKEALLQDLNDLSVILETETEDMGRSDTAKAFEILNNWLARSQTENGILQSRLAQVATEREALQFELDHYRESKHLTQRYAYLQPQEPLPLDEETRLNETLARAKEFLFTISEINEIVEQNQIQGVILLESVQEQISNIHNLHGNPEEETSFIIQAEYFLEDLRTAQSVLRELVKLQKLLEDTFTNAMKMKDKFDHLTNINQHNYIQINNLYTQVESFRTKNEETDQILRTVQSENESLRQKAVQAMAQNKGDSLTIENLQTELITALEEITILRDRIEQDQDKIMRLQLTEEMTTEGIKENNQIIISLLQDMLQPISSITSCANLLTNQFPNESAITELTNQMFASVNTIQDQVSKLISSTDRNLQLVSVPENVLQDMAAQTFEDDGAIPESFLQEDNPLVETALEINSIDTDAIARFINEESQSFEKEVTVEDLLLEDLPPIGAPEALKENTKPASDEEE
jgi:hypothetical protein